MEPKRNKRLEQFYFRSEIHFLRFDAANTNISRAVFDPIVTLSMDKGKLICELNNSLPHTEIYYTINNTYPVKFGQKYTGSFEIPEGNLSLRTGTFRDGKLIGRELIIPRTELEKRVSK